MSARQVKQWIVLRKDLGMRKGKMIAQGAHASLAAVFQGKGISKQGYLKIPTDDNMEEWLREGFTKVTLGVETEEEFHQLVGIIRHMGLPHAVIQDAGVTEFDGVPTYTAFALGPCQVRDAQKVIGHLKLL